MSDIRNLGTTGFTLRRVNTKSSSTIDDGNCADIGAEKLVEYSNKFGAEHFDLVLKRLSVKEYVKRQSYYRPEELKDMLYWNHVLLYNKKIKKYIDVSQNKIDFVDEVKYIEDFCSYPSIELYHIPATGIKMLSEMSPLDFITVAYHCSHTFISTQYVERPKHIDECWNFVKDKLCILRFAIKEI